MLINLSTLRNLINLSLLIWLKDSLRSYLIEELNSDHIESSSLISLDWRELIEVLSFIWSDWRELLNQITLRSSIQSNHDWRELLNVFRLNRALQSNLIQKLNSIWSTWQESFKNVWQNFWLGFIFSQKQFNSSLTSFHKLTAWYLCHLTGPMPWMLTIVAGTLEVET